MKKFLDPLFLLLVFFLSVRVAGRILSSNGSTKSHVAKSRKQRKRNQEKSCFSLSLTNTRGNQSKILPASKSSPSSLAIPSLYVYSLLFVHFMFFFSCYNFLFFPFFFSLFYKKALQICKSTLFKICAHVASNT